MRAVRRWSTRGTGMVAAFAAVIVLVLSLAGLALSLRTGGATRLGENVVAGEQALALARAAVAEASADFEAAMHDAGHPWNTAIRRTYDGSATNFTFEPVATRRAAAGIYGSAAVVSVVRLDAPKREAIWYRNELETTMLVGVTATASVDRPAIGRRAIRTVTQWRRVKVLYPAPPRPLGEYALFCLKPDHLAVYERQYRALQYVIEYTIAEAERNLGTSVPRPFASNRDVYRAHPYYRYPPFPYHRRAADASLPDDYDAFVASGCKDFMLLDHAVDPATTDLGAVLVATTDEVTGDDLRLRWPSLAEPSSTDDPTSFITRFESDVRTTLTAYHRTFGFITTASRDEFNECYLRPLIAADLDGAISVDDAIAFTTTRRCTHVFPDEASLWDEVGHGDVTLNGIYYVDGPVTVDMRYRGSGTVIGRNRMIVRRCERGDDDAICTLMSFCNGAGADGWQSIDVQCDAQAGLVALAGTIGNLHRHDVEGSVAVGFLQREATFGDERGRPYSWRRRRDPRLAVVDGTTGEALTDRAVVVVAPTVSATELERNS